MAYSAEDFIHAGGQTPPASVDRAVGQV